jgi:hypothetical protein
VGVQNIRSQVLLTLKRYELVNHALSDAPPINDHIWDRMETAIILSCIFSTITSELWDISKDHDVTTHQVWCMNEYQFIDNSETHAVHLDVTFRNFVQGDLSVSDYCHKMKSMVDSLADLGCVICDRNLVLNILRGLKKRYGHI